MTRPARPRVVPGTLERGMAGSEDKPIGAEEPETHELVEMVWQLLQVRQVTGVPLIVVGEMWQTLCDWARLHMVDRAPRPFASEADVAIPICVPTVQHALARLEPEITRFRQQWGAERAPIRKEP
jgi:hypothetical protein